MESLPFAGDRQVLAVTDSGNRLLGLSPVKAQVKDKSHSLTLQSTISNEPKLQTNDIGLKVVDEDDSDHTYTITTHRSIALLLGRARNAMEEGAPPSDPSENVSLGSTPIRRVALPSSAKHVSRDHAVIFHTPFGSAWAIKILGQNGLLVNGKRKRAGVVLKLIPFQSTLDFFGVKCLFVGSGQEEKNKQVQRESPLLKRAIESGSSPNKRSHPSSSRPYLGTEVSLSMSNRVASPLQEPSSVSPLSLKQRLVGNPLKRPLGAPPSPPTSSPAPFDLSSPVKSQASRSRHLIASSSPAVDAEESEEESSDEDDVRGASPSLSRRSCKHDDSGIVMEQDSADEASQALRTEVGKPRMTIDLEKSISDEESDLSPSPSPTPARKTTEKRVKFISQDVSKSETKEKAMGSNSSAAAPSFQKIQNHLRSQVATLAETYDLQGLLAQAIVFHRTATISATEAVRSVLTSTTGLLRGEVGPNQKSTALEAERGTIIRGWSFEEIAESDLACGDEVDREKVEMWQKKAWREKLEMCLMEGECFGIISRAGKDASGNPLECWYYYDKDRDTDIDRATNLGALAKPMRAALKTHKPIFWKKSAYGHSNDSQQGKSEMAATASESQWGSSGSALDSMLFSRAAQIKAEEEASLSAVAQSSSWEETQYEEREKTWDRQGDDDFEMRAKKIRRKK